MTCRTSTMRMTNPAMSNHPKRRELRAESFVAVRLRGAGSFVPMRVLPSASFVPARRVRSDRKGRAVGGNVPTKGISRVRNHAQLQVAWGVRRKVGERVPVRDRMGRVIPMAQRVDRSGRRGNSVRQDAEVQYTARSGHCATTPSA
jgi:hypothetical protein